MDCIFCKIASGEISSQKILEKETYFVIRDISPQAPVHLLVIPKVHVDSVAAAQDNPALLGQLLQGACLAAEQEGLTDGFRVVINTGADGGQTVQHLHVHVLGGGKLAIQMG